MLDTNKGSSAMYMVCYRKLLFPWKQGQNVKFGPKIECFFSVNFSRALHWIVYGMLLNSCFHGTGSFQIICTKNKFIPHSFHQASLHHHHQHQHHHHHHCISSIHQQQQHAAAAAAAVSFIAFISLAFHVSLTGGPLT